MIDTSVAIVIATRDRLHLLKETIASVRAQGEAVDEIVVVDDGSDDGTWQWLSRCTGVRSIGTVAPGGSSNSVRAALARNRGLEEVESRFVMFLDDDDLMRPKTVQRLLRALRTHPRARLAVGGRIVFNDEGARRRARNYPRFTLCKDILPDLLAGWGAGVGQWLAPTETVRAVGGWRPLPAAEEWEIVVRLSAEGDAVLIPWVVLEERMHPGQWGWEPAERTDVFELVRSTFPDELVGRTRRRAIQAIGGAQVQDAAAKAYTDQRYADALKGYLAVAHTSPTIFFSRLRGPYRAKRIARSAAGLLLGRKAAVAARQILGAGRRFTKREPQGSTGWR
jgi:hypothetical protein